MSDRADEPRRDRFAAMYSAIGRPSIPPEPLLRALRLQALSTVRSGWLLMEAIDDRVLCRWFVGLGMADAIWSPTTFSKKRERLLASDVAAAFFDAVVTQARTAGLLPDEPFTVDSTQLDASYDMRRCVCWLRGQGLTPHVAAKRPFSAIDRRTTRHPGYAVSQQKRKLVEQVFGWMKTGARGARSGTVAAIASIGPSLRRGRLQPNPGTHLSW